VSLILFPLSCLSVSLSLSLSSISIPRFLPRILYHALEHHQSPPEITSPLSLSYSPNTSHNLICFLYYLSDICLIHGSFRECITQLFELVYLFCFLPFPVPLILFTLPLSIIFVFSTFTSRFFILTYFPRPLIISFISLSLFATIITKSSAYHI
jgi:hypothetical protein